MSTIYVAGASAALEECASYMRLLRDAGHVVAFDWVECIRAVGSANPRDASEADRLRWTLQDVNGVHRADTFWLLIPQVSTVGAWVELGIAYQAGRRIVVSGDWRASIFTALAHYRFDSHDEAFAWLTQKKAA